MGKRGPKTGQGGRPRGGKSSEEQRRFWRKKKKARKALKYLAGYFAQVYLDKLRRAAYDYPINPSKSMLSTVDGFTVKPSFAKEIDDLSDHIFTVALGFGFINPGNPAYIFTRAISMLDKIGISANDPSFFKETPFDHVVEWVHEFGIYASNPTDHNEAELRLYFKRMPKKWKAEIYSTLEKEVGPLDSLGLKKQVEKNG